MTTANSNGDHSIRETTTTTTKKKKKMKKHTVGAKANTTQWHLSYILFGGPAQFIKKTGESKSIRFCNAFSEGLSHDHLKGSAEKTGYLLKNSRCLLNGQKLRHELFDGIDDETKTAHQIMIENLEQQNKDAVAFLSSHGYDLINELLVPLDKVSKDEKQIRDERVINAVSREQQERGGI